MKIAIIYLGRRGSGGPIALSLGRALAAPDEVSAYLSAGLESLLAWSTVPFPVQTVITYTGLLEAAWTLAFPSRIRALAAQVRAWQPDILLFPMFHPWNAALQKELAPIPSIVFVHDPRPHPGLTGWLHARFENASLKAAAHCIILSQIFQPDLVRRGVPPEHITVVPHGVLPKASLQVELPKASLQVELPKASLQVEQPQSHPPRPDRQQSGPTLLFSGRITTYKGLDVLLAAFESLRDRRPGLRLCIAGEGSLAPYRRQLDRLKNVEVTNRWLEDSEIPPLFSRADIVVLPYTSASQSGVLAVAAGFGLPVIATRTGGLSEQIQSGETGLLVSPGSVEELAAAIERLLDDPALASRLGAALQQDFEQNRSWEQTAGLILKVCKQILTTNGHK